MNSTPKNTAVIVGVGEVLDKCENVEDYREPIALMQAALIAASEDSSAELLDHLDSLDVISEYSWPYDDAPTLLASRLSINPKRKEYSAAGGEAPVRYIHEAALRIANGDSSVCAIVGAEATYAVAKAKKTATNLPWSEPQTNPTLVRGRDLVHPQAYQLGIKGPVHIYPFYENAASANWGQTPKQARQESGALWQAYSNIAASNPNSWSDTALNAQQITEPSANNRLIAWPYTKFMVANPMVNQGAAIIMCSLEFALKIGIAPEKMIYVWGGAEAKEHTDFLKRPQYHYSNAQNLVLNKAKSIAGGNAEAFDFIELYSCFPCVPKMAKRSINIGNIPPTVTGGLSFFGAPLNNYMSHAVASITRKLRGANQAKALVYGQGEFVTKHHALVLANYPDPKQQLVSNYSLQAELTAELGEIPEFIERYQGPAVLETFTILYQRDGSIDHGVIIAKTTENKRLIACVANDQKSDLTILYNLDTQPVGKAGNVSIDASGRQHWHFT